MGRTKAETAKNNQTKAGVQKNSRAKRNNKSGEQAGNKEKGKAKEIKKRTTRNVVKIKKSKSNGEQIDEKVVKGSDNSSNCPGDSPFPEREHKEKATSNSIEGVIRQIAADVRLVKSNMLVQTVSEMNEFDVLSNAILNSSAATYIDGILNWVEINHPSHLVTFKAKLKKQPPPAVKEDIKQLSTIAVNKSVADAPTIPQKIEQVQPTQKATRVNESNVSIRANSDAEETFTNTDFFMDQIVDNPRQEGGMIDTTMSERART